MAKNQKFQLQLYSTNPISTKQAVMQGPTRVKRKESEQARNVGSLDFWLFFSQKNGPNTDLNHKNVEFGGPLKSP